MFMSGELMDLYQTDFLLAKEHNISLTEINEMIPFERTIFIKLILNYLDKKQKAMR